MKKDQTKPTNQAVKEDRATANIIMRLTPEQKNKMVANAQKDGKSLTQFVLSRCL